jgi:hypothetical protein
LVVRVSKASPVTIEAMLVKYPFVSRVVGISQYQGVASRCTEGMVILIEREPENPYDANACKIMCDGETVGYLPRTLAAKLVRNGGRYWHGVVAKKYDSKATIGMEVQITGGGEESHETSFKSSTAVGELERIVVVKRSGRVLGALLRVERGERRVIVASEGGEISYPDGLVEIVERGRRLG